MDCHSDATGAGKNATSRAEANRAGAGRARARRLRTGRRGDRAGEGQQEHQAGLSEDVQVGMASDGRRRKPRRLRQISLRCNQAGLAGVTRVGSG